LPAVTSSRYCLAVEICSTRRGGALRFHGWLLVVVLCSCSGGTRAEAVADTCTADDTALILAASEGREDVVNDLHRRGVDVNAGHDANATRRSWPPSGTRRG